ncbi:MAG: FAD binding domain-containing protein [Actinomycetota bacterium]|nr:FAD binding domain-containing protein [Actinomycetota bacterium]
MRPAPFALERPGTVSEAVEALAAGGHGARLLAGGQSLVPQLTRRELAVDRLIDLGGVTELCSVRVDMDALRLGAMGTVATLEDDPRIAERWPLLAECARHVGHRPIRVRSTVGGAVAFADPPAEVPLALAVLGAEIEIAGPNGSVRVRAGARHVAPGELITAVTVPSPETGGGWGFHEVSRRSGDRALAVAAAVLTPGSTLRIATATATEPPRVLELPGLAGALDEIDVLEHADDELTHRALRESVRHAVAQARARAGGDA